MSRKDSTKAERLASLYAQIPSILCKGECYDACGPIAMTALEYRRIVARRGGREPVSTSLDCPLLSADGRCTVYADRPEICRIYGVVKALPCPYGCRPKRWLSHEEAVALHREIAALSGSAPLVYLAPPGWGNTPAEVLIALKALLT